MSTPTPLPRPPEWMRQNGPIGIPELSDRDSACLVLADLDFDAQLAAIRGLLRLHDEADQALRGRITEIEAYAARTSGLRNEAAVAQWTDRLHHSVYQDAAQSMAAAGMLAPLIESIFYQAFQGIRTRLAATSSPPGNHARWQQPAEDQWDCHFVWKSGRRSTNLVDGILQLAEAVSLARHFPEDLRATLDALFAYRNKMFHCGFEWPLPERRAFQKRINDSGWPQTWFALATSGGEPWVFYLTRDFIDYCLEIVGRVIEGIGAFCKAELLSRHVGQETPG